MISISVSKNASNAPQLEEDELQKDGKKSWKTMEDISINLYCIDFFYCNKKITKRR